MKPLENTNTKMLEDAVRLLKSDFVAFYVEMGYDKITASISWHSLRTSAKGHELMSKLYKGRSLNGAISFIGDVEDEAKVRIKKTKK